MTAAGTTRIVAVGDIMLGDSSACVGYGFASRHPRSAAVAFTATLPILQGADIAFGNLECLLCDGGKGSTRHARDQMRAPPSFAADLREAGFTALSVANNHAMQHGRGAFAETVAHLERAGILCVGLRGSDGWCANPAFTTTARGARVAILGYSWRPRQYSHEVPPYAEGDADAVIADVRRAGASSDVIIVSLHWGEEFVTVPSEVEVTAARAIIDAGARMVLGHHPHVTRPTERHAGGVICYGLGNFVTDMLWQPALREGAILDCTLVDGAIAGATIRLTWVDRDYRVGVGTAATQVAATPVRGLAANVYERAVAATVSLQRRALYAYAARHAWKVPFPVLTQLVAVTLRNRIATLLGRLLPRRRTGAAGASAQRR